MATVKKTKKAQDGWIMKAACTRGFCGQSRRERRYAGEALDQRLLKGIGLSTQEGIDRRQQKRDERKEARRARREERRSGGDAVGAWKNGGKMAKKSAVKKAKPSMKKGGKINKSSKKK